ncbi:MAG: shikimate dehydrogenase [Helicobacteraceae bacterium]|jgi:shikimate dehydrogenase|nr:shikimate dehydrogenase [Helicobacteraceae bacterium]
MQKMAVFGNPIEHSLSPIMHNYVYKEHGIDAIYERYLLEKSEDLRKIFDREGYRGINITVPHKEAAFSMCDEVSDIAQKIGAVNTWHIENGKVVGYNTDAIGFICSISKMPLPKNTLIIGAGGAAKAIAIALMEADFTLTILNRTKDRLYFFENFGIKTLSWKDNPGEGYDLIINTTSAGLKDNTFPLEQERLAKLFDGAKSAIDIIYGKVTPFLRLAKEKKLTVKDGEDMLIYQGATAHSIFFNDRDTSAIAELMRKALLEHKARKAAMSPQA